MATLTECPECAGRRLMGDPSGLRIAHTLSCAVGLAETQTVAADHDRGALFERPATAAEAALLTAGGATVPAGQVTRVRWLSNGFRRREWPGIEWED